MTTVEELPALLQRTERSLRDRGVPDEAVAEFRAARGRVFRRGPKLQPLARVRRIGVLLLGEDGAVYGVGRVTRAVAPGHANNQAVSAEERRDMRRAAFEGAFEPGDVVNYDVVPVDLNEPAEPFAVRDGAVFIRWRPGGDDASLMPIAHYLEDRVGLLP
ncbi:hypothetical protein HQQ80_02370 [Microbacteriaceae bacterium VKM Ac-2855]|nr:hypothetical protein [Microbacteriaceae bacterium VKM Ac-2855]